MNLVTAITADDAAECLIQVLRYPERESLLDELLHNAVLDSGDFGVCNDGY